MAITYVGGQVGGRAGSTGTSVVTFALTGGSNATPQAGDLVIISIAVGTQTRWVSGAITAPTGYSSSLQAQSANGTYDTLLCINRKFMGATPDTTFTAPSSGNTADAQAWSVQVFRGVKVETPWGLDGSGYANFGTARPYISYVDPSGVNSGAACLFIGAGSAAAGAPYTAPANFTSNFLTTSQADTNDVMIGAGYWLEWPVGPTGPHTFGGGTTGANDSWAAFIGFLNPAVTGTTHNVTVSESGLASEACSHGATEQASSTESVSATSGENADNVPYEINRGYFAAANGVSGVQINSETMFRSVARIATARNALASGQSTSKAYFAGGLSGASSTRHTLVDGMSFWNEICSPISGALQVGRSDTVGVSSREKAYYGGGQLESYNYTTEIDAIVFSSDTASNPAAALATARVKHAGLASSVKGYWCGGLLQGGSSTGEVDGITFATEAAINPAAAVTTGSVVAYAASNTRGYCFSATSAYGIQFDTEASFTVTATFQL